MGERNAVNKKVHIRPALAGVRSAVEETLVACGIMSLARTKRDVFLKVNGIDFKACCYTAPEVLEAALAVLRDIGASRVRVMENCTQGNFTRLVFRETGYAAICKKYKAAPLYLDEGKRMTIPLKSMGYDVGASAQLAPLAEDPQSVLYINIPKLKTHSMSTVTLGIKNQFGMIDQADRIRDHNYKLHTKLVDIFRVFRPDITMVDGIQAIFNGHYPAAAHLDRSMVNMNIIFGSRDTLAADVVGARILGYSVDEVEHLRLAREAGLGCGNLDQIELDGELPPGNRKYNCDILMDFPDDVKIIRGSELCCAEGCRKNTETLIQTLYRDYGGSGGFTVIMGKGFDRAAIENISGPVHLAGMCAVAELESAIRGRAGGGRMTKSDGCNNLAASIEGLCAQMGVRVIRMTPNPVAAACLLATAKFKGSRARIPKLF